MVQNVLYSHNSDEWETPQGFFDELNGRYHFELDVCATDGNRKCLRYFTKQDDGLSRKWGGGACGAILRILTLRRGCGKRTRKFRAVGARS